MNKAQIRKANKRDKFNFTAFMYNGKEYNSYGELARDYGVNPSTFYYRIRRGYSLSDALKPSQYPERKTLIAPDGKQYPTIAAMARAYKLSRTNLSARLHRGLSIEEALVDSYKLKAVCDHKGNKYKSITDMCNAYGINRTTYISRIVYGKTKEQALTIPVGAGKKHEKDI